MDLALDGNAPADAALPPPTEPLPRPAPSMEFSNRAMLLIGAAVIVVFVLLGLFLRQRQSPDAGDVPTTEDVAPAQLADPPADEDGR